MKFKTVYKFYIKSVLLTCMMTLLCFSGPYPPVVDGGNPDAKRLYDDLLSNYNKLVRPVVNVSEAVTVMLKLKLSQLIDVNLKNQIMTTNLWVEQYWYDYKLKWDAEEYGGVNMLHVPSDHIWRPDIVLYNNADGNFEVTLATKATILDNGKVEWKPPAIYHSSCEMDVEYFPFDEQTCVMKFGSWTYDGGQVDLRHIDEVKGQPEVEIGVDLSEFYMSVEWDILEVPAVRNVKWYTCCTEPYLDITFNVTMRRKTLFYTVNLIIPCMGISFLTVLVFYLPSDSGEKVSLSISILLSLTVFFLLLAEIIPPTSLVVPLLGKFVLFTMILDTFSICVTVVVLNVHFRTPQTHTMAPWVRRVFIHILPRLLVMRRPYYDMDKHSSANTPIKNNKPTPNRILVRTCDGLELRDPPYLPASPSPPRLTMQGHINASRTSLFGGGGGVGMGYGSANNLAAARKAAAAAAAGNPNSTAAIFDDITASFYMPQTQYSNEHHNRPKSSMSKYGNSAMGIGHGNFKSMRSLNGDQSANNYGGLPLNGNCRIHSQSNDNLHRRFSTYLSSLTMQDSPHHAMSQKTGQTTTGDVESPDGARGSHPFGTYASDFEPPPGASLLCPEVSKALSGVLLIAEQKKRNEECTKVIEDWKYVAMVLDRLFLWIFTVAVLVGTAGIILQAPTLYDDREPLDVKLSEIGLATADQCRV